jgi:hypothetical protein
MSGGGSRFASAAKKVMISQPVLLEKPSLSAAYPADMAAVVKAAQVKASMLSAIPPHASQLQPSTSAKGKSSSLQRLKKKGSKSSTGRVDISAPVAVSKLSLAEAYPAELMTDMAAVVKAAQAKKALGVGMADMAAVVKAAQSKKAKIPPTAAAAAAQPPLAAAAAAAAAQQSVAGRRLTWAHTLKSAALAATAPAVPLAISAADVGSRVRVDGYDWFEMYGTLRFYGMNPMAGNIQCGVEMDSAVGEHNGCVKGRIYFKCEPKHGVLVAPTKLTLETVAAAAATATAATAAATGEVSKLHSLPPSSRVSIQSLASIDFDFEEDKRIDEPHGACATGLVAADVDVDRPKSIATTEQPTRTAPPPPPSTSASNSPASQRKLSFADIPKFKHVFTRRSTHFADVSSFRL